MDSFMLTLEEQAVEEPLYSIPDNKPNKATSTLPEIYLRIGHRNRSSQRGVYAKNAIPYKTRFGPVDAPLVPFSHILPDSFLLKSKVQSSEVPYEHLYYNTSDETVCNWMCLVCSAPNFKEQNLIAHFVNDDIYYTTTRRIQPNEELKVWYAPKYALFMGKSPLTPTANDMNGSNEPLSNDKSQRFQYNSFTFSEDVGLKERSVPPKKRGWKQAKQHLNNKNNPNSLGSENQNNNWYCRHNTQAFDSSDTSKQPQAQNSSLSGSASNGRINGTLSCPECGKLFAKKYTLKVHRTTHLSTYDFLCHSCGKGFKRKDKLNDHLRRVHRSYRVVKAPRPTNSPQFIPRVQPKDCEKFLYKCLRCSVGFQRRGMLVNHFLKKHPDVNLNTIPELALPIYKDVIKFACLHCDKSYNSNSKRNHHMKRHHPGRMIPTDIRTSRKAGEQRSDVFKKCSVIIQPHSCPFCPSQYKNKAKLNKHIKSKHKNATCNDDTSPQKPDGVSTSPSSVHDPCDTDTASGARSSVDGNVNSNSTAADQSLTLSTPNTVNCNNVVQRAPESLPASTETRCTLPDLYKENGLQPDNFTHAQVENHRPDQIQKFNNKPLPTAYSRGRKQFLLQFCGDSSAKNSATTNQSATDMNDKQTNSYSLDVNFIEETFNSEPGDLANSRYNQKDITDQPLTRLSPLSTSDSWLM